MSKYQGSIYEMDNPNAINDWLKLIDERIDKKIKNASFNKMLPGIVVSANNTNKTATIKLNGDNIEISNVKNRSGEDLSTNDLVYVLFINNSSANFVITIKN